MLRHSIRRNFEDQVFELPGSPPACIWVGTCPDRKCDCRDLFILASQQGRQPLLDQLASISKSYQIGRQYGQNEDRTPPLGHLLRFNLDLDTARSYFITNSREIEDLNDDPQIRPIADRIDGELLDRIDELWHRGRGLPTPEQWLANAKQIRIEGWHPGDLIAWCDLCPTARRDLYLLGTSQYEALEYYCPGPACDCGKVTIYFEPGTPYSAEDPGFISVTPDAVSVEPHTPTAAPLLQRLWTAFQTRHPSYPRRFSQRYAIVRSAGARFATELDTPASVTKIGRNDPCPCGSGKKQKKCCGAT